MYQFDFLDIYTPFPAARGSLPRALGCGARRGPACTPRRKLGSRPGCVAGDLGVQSREIWQINTAVVSLYAELEPSKTTESSHFSFYPFVFAPLLHSHAATGDTRFKLSPLL